MRSNRSSQIWRYCSAQLATVGERCWVDGARTELCSTATCDQPGVFEDLDVFGDCRESEIERRGEIVHAGLTLGEAGKDRPACRVRQGGKGLVEPLVIECCVRYHSRQPRNFLHRLINIFGKYHHRLVDAKHRQGGFSPRCQLVPDGCTVERPTARRRSPHGSVPLGVVAHSRRVALWRQTRDPVDGKRRTRIDSEQHELGFQRKQGRGDMMRDMTGDSMGDTTLSS